MITTPTNHQTPTTRSTGQGKAAKAATSRRRGAQRAFPVLAVTAVANGLLGVVPASAHGGEEPTSTVADTLSTTVNTPVVDGATVTATGSSGGSFVLLGAVVVLGAVTAFALSRRNGDDQN